MGQQVSRSLEMKFSRARCSTEPSRSHGRHTGPGYRGSYGYRVSMEILGRAEPGDSSDNEGGER